MKTHLPTNGTKPNERDGLFASTRWTIVLKAADSAAASAQSLSALSELCGIYWRPLYLFLRREGYGPDDAQDLTQSFFADLIETRFYAHAHPSKGRFRSFLLGALKHFLADTRDHDHAQKRGGYAIRIPMDETEIAETQDRFALGWNSERVYECEWAETLLRRTFNRLEKECMLAGKSELFACLRLHLSPGNNATLNYQDLSKQLGRPESTLRSDLTRLRARYRAILREEVGTTVAEPMQIDDELRYLCRVVTVNYDDAALNTLLEKQSAA